jgi:mono/diheme cytochrome c family protein
MIRMGVTPAGLYPAPPNLTITTVDAAHAFWVIKHGIKASGMPAWGKSMEDAYIWNMAAFLQQRACASCAKQKHSASSWPKSANCWRCRATETTAWPA